VAGAVRLSPDEACERLAVDAWALGRLIALGELEADPDGTLCAMAVDRLSAERQTRRLHALADLAALDGPHMGQTP
jgi:hypothetical protein